LEFAATFRRSLDDDVHEISFLVRDVDRHLGRLDDRHLDDPGHLHLDLPDVLLHQHLDPLDERLHQMEDDHLGHLDEHPDQQVEHRPEPKDASGRQCQQGHDQVLYPTSDQCEHLHRHPDDLLKGRLVA
jgi:hypothetical protein